MTSFLKSVTKIRSEFDSSLFFLRSRKNVGHPIKQTTYSTNIQNFGDLKTQRNKKIPGSRNRDAR